MLLRTGIFLIAIFMMSLSGCATEPEGADEAELASAVASDEPAAAATSCSVVVTCNAAGPEGTRCRQQGCSAGAAALECALESVLVCGTPVCPVILVRTNGARENLCNGGRL